MMKTIQGIATEMGSTRQNVFQILQRGLDKVYKTMKRNYPKESPFEIILMIAKEFGVTQEKDFERFYADFSVNVRREVTKDALRLVRVNPNVSFDSIINHNTRKTHRWDKKVEHWFKFDRLEVKMNKENFLNL